jgi:cyanophycin synthetase
VANALAAAAAADALGISVRHIRAGLRSFGQDTVSNPGRLNLFEGVGVRVLVDFAHNEAGLAGLLEVARSLTGPAGRLRLALGTAGDRTDEILGRMGALSGARTDDLVICEKRHYLRGRSVAQMNRIFRDGARAGGYRGRISAYATELGALRALLTRARPGDVVAVMSHVERAEIFAWLGSHDFKPLSPDDLGQAG